jgi:acyl-CoA hydrolase
VKIPSWSEFCQSKIETPTDAVRRVRRGDRVFIGSGCGEPQKLVSALAEMSSQLADTEIVHILNLGVAPYARPKLDEKFRLHTFFIGENERSAVAEARADYTPVFLSDVPNLFRKRRVPLDVALVQVSPPDQHGWCSYGVSVDITKAAAESAETVIAEINPNMPRSLGDSFIHANHIDAMVPSDLPLLEFVGGEETETTKRIGSHVAHLIGLDGEQRPGCSHGNVFRRPHRSCREWCCHL